MLYVKILITLICSALFWWGGFNYHNARRFIMPLILTASCFILTHFCLLALTQSVSIGALCLGYGDKSPLRHVFGDGWGRGIWGLIVGACLSLALFLSGSLAWYFFAFYLALNFTLENALKKLPQSIGDPVIGAGFASIVFLIH